MTETMFKVALLKAGTSQHQLALRLGLHPSTVSRIVAGMFVPPPEIQKALRAALGEHGNDLVFGYRLRADDNSPIRATEEEK